MKFKPHTVHIPPGTPLPFGDPNTRPIEYPFQQMLENRADSPVHESRAEPWLSLIRYMERNINYPPQWAMVSLSRGCLYMTEVDTWDPQNARVEIYLAFDQYKIRYRMSESDAPWKGTWGAWVTGCTPDVEEAAQMIVTGLQRAATNLPYRGQV